MNAYQPFDERVPAEFGGDLSCQPPARAAFDWQLNRPRVLDLFCGTGGFTRGLLDSGFEIAASVDIDEILTSSHSFNFPKAPLRIADIGELSASDLTAIAGKEIDGIVGGPPCQAFSNIGKRDPSDPRRTLLIRFFELVAEIRPKFFVMENVLGLGQGEARSVLDAAIQKLEGQYAVTGPFIVDASDFGAATTRKRLFVVGTLKGEIGQFSLDKLERRRCGSATVAQAIGDLCQPRRMLDHDGFDVWRITKKGRASRYARMLRSPNGKFTGHLPTEHTQLVRKRFSTVPEGGTDSVGRHPRLAWSGLCPTLRAGTGSDKGSFQSVRPIHPSEDRVITVREAARLQGFPDEHRFHPTIWHSFRMIGNSVSPFVARAILFCVREVFESSASAITNGPSIPKSEVGR